MPLGALQLPARLGRCGHLPCFPTSLQQGGRRRRSTVVPSYQKNNATEPQPDSHAKVQPSANLRQQLQQEAQQLAAEGWRYMKLDHREPKWAEEDLQPRPKRKAKAKTRAKLFEAGTVDDDAEASRYTIALSVTNSSRHTACGSFALARMQSYHPLVAAVGACGPALIPTRQPHDCGRQQPECL